MLTESLPLLDEGRVKEDEVNEKRKIEDRKK
jgi:hypothetical protein